ncbi:MAG: UbiA family prenyltransferase [Chloroflexota bacterium]
MQFVWQFPHFWAIAWVAHKDYSKAGFKLLPSDKGPTKFTAVQTIMYSTLMLPIGVLPYYYNISGITSLWILMACNIAMIGLSIRLYLNELQIISRCFTQIAVKAALGFIFNGDG